MDWIANQSYGVGVNPAVALNKQNIAIEVHESSSEDSLWYRVGVVVALEQMKVGTIFWGEIYVYGEGTNPRVAVNEAGVVVVVSQLDDTLQYSVGKVDGESRKVSFGDLLPYEIGLGPAVTLNNQGLVVEVHRKHRDDTLQYRMGEVFQNKTIAWASSVTYDNDDNGEQPSVALTGDGFVIEVHHSQGKLWKKVGKVSGNIIDWKPSMNFDDGRHPSVATNGKLAVQSHESENFSTLWFSTALVTDRARWMEQRLLRLKDRTLKDLVLPASHDAGMYLDGLATLGKTQNLNIYFQLADGIRYFDLRPKWSNGKLYITHGLITGPLLQDVLNDIKRFMNEGHRELVIFKFSHYDNFSDEVYSTLVKQIAETIGTWLYKSDDGHLADVTLENYLKKGGVALVVCDGLFPVKNSQPGIWIYRDWDSTNPKEGNLRVFDQYSNTLSYDDMKNDQFKKFESYNGVCRNSNERCDLFLLSWTLTPPTDVQDASKPANRHLGQAITELTIPNTNGKIVNLVYVDYVEYARVTDVCLYLNKVPFPDVALI